MAASSGDHTASGGVVGCASDDESACSTPFVSAPSSPDRDPSFSAAGCFYSAQSRPARDPSFSAASCFYSAAASPARGGGPGTADEYGCELGFDFDFASHCPSPAAAAMSSADELFHNGQIRPMRLASFLLRPQALPPLDGDVPPPPQPPPSEPSAPAGADERGRLRRRSVNRRYRSLSPFRARWLSSSSSSPDPAAKSVEPAAAGEGEVAPSSPRSSSSSSTASSASSSPSSRSYYRSRWGFLKDILHRRKSYGGERPPSPADASRGRGRAKRSSADARLYEAWRAEAEEMRRCTFLPYREGLLGLGSRGDGAMHGLAAAAAAGKARP